MGDIDESHTSGQLSVTSGQPTLEQEPMERGSHRISPVKVTIDRCRKEVIKKIDILRKKLGHSPIVKSQMANEEIHIVRRRLEQLDKESLVAFQTVAEKNSYEAEKCLQEIEMKGSNTVKEFETINFVLKNTQKSFEEALKMKPQTETKKTP